MGPVKRVLLGSAVGIVAAAGAQAADLPVKAKPVEYVKVCSLYGAGFWYVPGTDTCIKIGAYAKLQTEYNGGTGVNMMGSANAGAGDPGGRQTRVDSSNFTWNNRGVVSFDMRTQTEYGTLRSYIDIGVQTQQTNSNAGGNVGVGGGGAPAAALFNSRAFIQFAGFTAGRMRSFFDLYFQGAYTFSGQRFAADTSPGGIIGIAYTWQFGGGLSASLSLEDAGYGGGGRGRSIVNLSGPGGAPLTIGGQVTDDRGQQFFDPVFNLRLDQAWGFVGISAALHDASAGYYGTTEDTGHPSDKFGWAVSPGFLWNNPLGLQGDTLAGQGVYSVGAAGYATAAWGPWAVFKSGQSVGLGWANDGVYDSAAGRTGLPTNIELTTVWSFNAAYEHRWDPKWRTSIYGGMIGVEYSGGAKTLICGTTAAQAAAPRGTTLAGVTNCDPNWSASEVGTRTMWNPVPDLDVGLDLVWWHMNTAFAGQAVLPTTGAKPGGLYNISNQDALAAIFRIQRNFLY